MVASRYCRGGGNLDGSGGRAPLYAEEEGEEDDERRTTTSKSGISIVTLGSRRVEGDRGAVATALVERAGGKPVDQPMPFGALW